MEQKNLLERAISWIWPTSPPDTWAEKVAGLEEKMGPEQRKLSDEKAQLEQLTEAGVFSQGITAVNGSKQREALRRQVEDRIATLEATRVALDQARDRAFDEAFEGRCVIAEKIGEEYRTHGGARMISSMNWRPSCSN